MAPEIDSTQRDLGRLEGQVSSLVKNFDAFRQETAARFDSLDRALQTVETDQTRQQAAEDHGERWGTAVRQSIAGTFGGVIVLVAQLFIHRGP